MRHATCKLADRLHFLAMGKAHFEIFLLGLVDHVQHGNLGAGFARWHDGDIGIGDDNKSVGQPQRHR